MALPLGVAALVGLITIDGSFVYDDVSAIRESPVVQGTVPWTEAFSRDFWGGPVGPQGVSWRPVAPLIWRALWTLGGGSPWPFRVASLLFHVAATGAAFALFRRGLDLRTATVGALLFALHPAHAEVIGGIVSHADLLAFALGATSLTLVLGPNANARRVVIAALLLAFGGAAKETAFLFGPLAALALLADRSVPRRTALGRAAPLVAVAIAIVAIQLMLPRQAPTVYDNLAVATGGLTRLAHTLYTVAKGAAVCFVPTGIAPNHGYAAVDLDPATLWPVAASGVLLTLLGVGLLGWSAFTGRWRLAAALGLLIGTLALQCNLLFYSPSDLAERLLYPATAAACALVAAGLGQVANRRQSVALVLAISLVFAAGTVTAQRPWHDELALWEHAAEVEPKAWRSQRALGAVLRKRGDTHEGGWHWMLMSFIQWSFPNPVDFGPVAALEQLPVHERLLEGPGQLLPSDPCGLAALWTREMYTPEERPVTWAIFRQRYGCGDLPSR